MSNVKVYTVNGAVHGSSSSIPDWLTKARTKGKREHVEGQIELIQGFEFPEASNRVKTTRDGHHAIATGTYKPQMRVWDLDELTLKFERHGDAENVDFVILSDDWTKTIHLQNDRTVELHTQSGFHYRTRIPRFGRSLAYHAPSCDALVAASGNEIYRLNLEQGRFLSPLVITDDDGPIAVNCIDVNPAHQLLAFGIDGRARVQFWDPRSRAAVGTLDLPHGRIAPSTGRAKAALPGVVVDDDNDESSDGLGVTAIASRSDGLSYAIGTSTGHTLLYDVRSPRPFAIKDQGYGLPLKNVAWLEGGSRMAGDGLVLGADKKVVKIWDRNTPSTNFVSITPATDLNDVHHIPGSGLLLSANEGIKMASYYIPQLGPAPRWASFLENITEEMEDESVRNVYEDYKFIERNELRTLGLDHLVGTRALKPYMHGYFVSLKLYDTARVIANPFAYAEHREKLVQERLAKMADTRIRARKGGAATAVKVNKALAERIERNAERERKREEKRRTRRAKRAMEDGEGGEGEGDMSVDEKDEDGQVTLLDDPRFKDLFEDADFAVDETSREYALLNPSSAAQKRSRTAVEDEEEESDRMSSSDGTGSSSGDEESDDSSDAGALDQHDPRSKTRERNARLEQAYLRTREANRKVDLVPLVPAASSKTDGDVSFGQRLQSKPSAVRTRARVGTEMRFVPSGEGEQKKKKLVRRGVERFGAGMERGADEDEDETADGGRRQRRKGMRSGTTEPQYAAAARVPLIKSPAVRVPPPVQLPPDIHPLPESVTAYFAYPFVLEPHVLALEASRRNTLATYAARRESLLRSREEEKEERRRVALRRVAPGFDGNGTPLEPVRSTQPGGGHEDGSVMDDLVNQLEKMASRTS